MSDELVHPDIAEALSAFALDALDAGDAADVEAHLSVCAPCRAEVDEFRELASALAVGEASAPRELWWRIASAMDA